MGRLTSQVDPLGNTTSYEYDAANNRKAVINPYLKRFEYGYDAHNNLVSAKDPYDKSVFTQYNTDNLPVKVTDLEGKETFYEYDSEGRLISTTDGNGNKITMEYTENAGQQCVSCGEGGRGASPSAIVYRITLISHLDALQWSLIRNAFSQPSGFGGQSAVLTLREDQ